MSEHGKEEKTSSASQVLAGSEEETEEKGMIRNFLNKRVAIKLGEGYVIEGTLIHVDNSQGHNGGIGNLILVDGTIRTVVRGSSVLHVALKR